MQLLLGKVRGYCRKSTGLFGDLVNSPVSVCVGRCYIVVITVEIFVVVVIVVVIIIVPNVVVIVIVDDLGIVIVVVVLSYKISSIGVALFFSFKISHTAQS